MASEAPRELFYSYSSKDEPFRVELERHLSVVRRDNLLTSWSFRELAPGTLWDPEIRKHLDRASIILLLVSASFLESEYIWNVEIKSVLDRHRRGVATVIPVILKPCDWQATPLGVLQALPTNAKPIVAFRPRDKGWMDVVRGVRHVITDQLISCRELLPPPERIILARPVPTRVPQMRVLVIEDDVAMRAVYHKVLQRSRHCEVHLAEDGRKGIQLMQESEFHIVILDLMMPNMSGEEWMEWYKSQPRQDAHVIIISASRNILKVARGLRNVSALSKPFDLDDLDELMTLIWAERSQSLVRSEGSFT